MHLTFFNYQDLVTFKTSKKTHYKKTNAFDLVHFIFILQTLKQFLNVCQDFLSKI